MNKTERAAFEAMRERAALGWPAPPPKPVSPDDMAGGNTWGRGWWTNIHSGRVGEGVTRGTVHAHESYSDEQLANQYKAGSYLSLSQGSGGPWYASKLDALRALHWETAKRFAEKLAQIEREIEEAAG